MSALPDYVQDPDKGLLLFPVQASTGAHSVDLLFYALLGISVLMSLVVFGLVVYFGIRYRKGSNVARKPPLAPHKTHPIEIGWALGLLALFMVFFVWGVHVFTGIYQGPHNALTINVVGKQWMWKLQHPDGTREINTLHVPTGRDIRLDVTSADVIHSIYIPAFRLKRDAVPGLHRSAWFHATKPGTYRLFCAEFCGTDHSRMRGKVIVMRPADYQQWLQDHGHGNALAGEGKQLFSAFGCAGCHRGKAAVRAPNLDGIYGRSVPLASGKTKAVDEAYLRDSILQPTKDVVAGYVPVMPSFKGRISEGELQRIVAYIKSLKPGDWKQEGGG